MRTTLGLSIRIMTTVSNRTQMPLGVKHSLPLRSSLTSGISVGAAAVVVVVIGCMFEAIASGIFDELVKDSDEVVLSCQPD